MMQKFWCTLLICFSFSQLAFADDATFGPATPIAPKPVAVSVASPITPVVPVPVPATDSPSFFFAFLTNAAVISVFAAVVIRVEAAIQQRTKINIANGVGIAHTIFSLLRDKGLIAHGSVSDALYAFWNELDLQSQVHLGTAPNALIQDTAHATFSRLLKEQLDKTPTGYLVKADGTKVALSPVVSQQRTPPPLAASN